MQERKNREREHRIKNKIIVDAYNAETVRTDVPEKHEAR
jgi:hypothetical protein